MDRNFLLAIALSFAFMAVWTMYTNEQRAPQEGVPAAGELAGDLPGATAADPAAGTSSFDPVPTAPLAQEPLAAAVETPTAPERTVVVKTPLFEAELTSHGGALKRWDLLEYDDPSREGAPQVDMVTASEGGVGLETPFEELGYGNLSQAAYEISQPDPLTVVFTREHSGARLRKTYLFDPDHYLFRLRIEVENATDRHLRPSFLVTWPAVAREGDDFNEFNLGAYRDGDLEIFPVLPGPSFLGFGGGVPDEVVIHERNVDWAGAHTRYFLAGLIPDLAREASVRFEPIVPGEAASLQLGFERSDVPPGGSLEREIKVYLGPKIPDRLDAAGAHLDEAILKGWFPSLTRFFTWLLGRLHSIVSNYGIAIIMITIAVRLLMWPLMQRQMKSMKRMSVLQPRLKEIQEKFPDDRQKQSEAMMSVYKEAGVNPLSMMTGCLPMFLQLPVFIGFYYALQGSIELRQQPFFGWMDDLSQPEALFTIPGLDLPVRLLPLLMGGSMLLQQKLTPSTMDPAQARMMLIMMPVMFTLLFYEFASGLVLYWLVSTLLGIAQQVFTNRAKD